MALVQINIIPLGTPTASVGDWIADSITVLEKAGIAYEIGPAGTLLEGKPAQVLKLAQKMHEAAFNRGIQRVYTTIILDDRRDKEVTLKSKVASIQKRLKRNGKSGGF